MRAFAAFSILVASACSSHHGDAGPDGGSDRAGDAGVADGPSVMGGDFGFGDAGLVTVNLGAGLAGLTAVGQQSDGELVAAGATQEAIFVVRATAAGQLDTAFGTAGVTTIPLGLPSNGVGVDQVGLAVQADDKLVVAGRLPGGAYGDVAYDAVIRLTADGALDTGFGSGGLVVQAAALTAVAVTPTGEILVGESFQLVELGSDGTPDPGFGSAGVARVPTGVTAFAVGSDGRIVTASTSGITRLLATGAIDTSFGSAGTLAIPAVTDESQIDCVAIAAGGAVVVGGAFGSGGQFGEPPFAVLRATAAGALDATFGSGGIVTDGSTDNGLAEGIALTGSGGVLVIGPASFGSAHQNCVQLDASGAFVAGCGVGVTVPLGGPLLLADGAYAVPGADEAGLGVTPALAEVEPVDVPGGFIVEVGAGGSFDRAQMMAVQADGSILVGGWTYAQTPLVRLTSTGALDTGFGAGGFVGAALAPLELEWIDDVAVQPGGGIVVGGPPEQGGFVAARLDATGALDASFGSAGSVALHAIGSTTLLQSHGQTVAADGSIYIVGESTTGTGIGQFAVVHLTADGAVDTGFGAAGLATTAFTAAGDHFGYFASPGSDGSVVVAGYSGATASIVRFAPGGVLDPTFAGSGELDLTDTFGIRAFGLARGSDGSVAAVAGDSLTGALYVVRITAAGALDPGFGSAGTATLQLGGGNDYEALTAPAGVAIDAAGNVLVGVSVASPTGLVEQAVLVRLLPDGSADTSWGPAGVQTLALSNGTSTIHALRFQPDGKLLAAGRRWTVDGSSDYAVLRLIY